MNNTVLEIEHLQLSYNLNPPIVDEVTLSLLEGEVVVLLGENGVGKSTLIKTIAGITPYNIGSISLFGKKLANWSRKDLARKMALVLTHPQLQGLLKVKEFISYGRYPFTNWLGSLKTEDQIAVEESIRLCGLESLSEKSINEISDGERQKVFLARALAQKCNLLILDEPTTHLDVKNTTSQLKLLKKLSREEGKTIVFSSHQFDLAMQIADKIWLFNEKKVHQISPAEFYNDCKYQEMLLGRDYQFDKISNRFTIKL